MNKDEMIYGVSHMHPHSGVAIKTGLTYAEAEALAEAMNRGAA